MHEDRGIIVEAVKLSKAYNSRANVLDRISFQVDKGETFVVIGPSGAGKTTLLRLIDLLEHPSSGQLRFTGQETTQLDNYDMLKLRRRIGMVFQSTILFNTTVYSNVAYGLRLRDKPDDVEEKSVSRALKTVGLHGFKERHAKTLSGGEAQRVAIARVLAYEPELLLLDEPTANLDPTNTSTVEEAIRKAKQEYGATVIIATHNMFQAKRLGTRIALLLGGKFVEVSDPEKMFTDPWEPVTRAFIKGELIY
jgi:tungstate transport system ATP-binding protein